MSAALSSYLDDSREDHHSQWGNDDDYDEHFNDDNDYAEEEFRSAHSIAGPYRRDAGADIEDPVDENDAAEMLQNYRQRRDSGQDQVFSREDIRNSYKYYR